MRGLLVKATVLFLLLFLQFYTVCLQKKCDYPFLKYFEHMRKDGTTVCCQKITCSKGFEVKMCEKGGGSTSCIECKSDEFQPREIDSFDLDAQCQKKTVCASRYLIEVDSGSTTTDRMCACNVKNGYYATATPNNCIGKKCPVGTELYLNGSCLPCMAGFYRKNTTLHYCIPLTECKTKVLFAGNASEDAICFPVPKPVVPPRGHASLIIGIVIDALCLLTLLVACSLLAHSFLHYCCSFPSDDDDERKSACTKIIPGFLSGVPDVRVIDDSRDASPTASSGLESQCNDSRDASPTASSSLESQCNVFVTSLEVDGPDDAVNSDDDNVPASPNSQDVHLKSKVFQEPEEEGAAREVQGPTVVHHYHQCILQKGNENQVFMRQPMADESDSCDENTLQYDLENYTVA